MQTQHQWPWEIVQGPNGALTRYTSHFTRTLPSRSQPDLGNNTFSITNVSALQTVLLIDDIAPSYVVAANASDAPQIKWLNDVVARVDFLANVLTDLIRNTPDANTDVELVHGIA